MPSTRNKPPPAPAWVDATAEILFRTAVERFPESTPALLLADRLDEIGLPESAAHVRQRGVFGYGDGDGGGGGDGDGDGGGYGGGGGGGYGDGGYGDGDGGDGYGDGGYGGGGGGDGYEGYDGYGYGYNLTIRGRYREGIIVRDGLYILTIPGGYSPYVIVAWVERHDLFLRLAGARVIRRFGSRAQLSVLAAKGPQSDTQLLDPSPEEWVPVGSVGRVIPADPDAWRDQCPAPGRGG